MGRHQEHDARSGRRSSGTTHAPTPSSEAGAGRSVAAADPRVRGTRLALGLAAAAALAVGLLALPGAPAALGRIDLTREVRPDEAMGLLGLASLVLAAVALGLALTTGRWLGPRRVPEEAALRAPPPPGRGFALAVGGALLVAAALAVPRLTLGLWDDEIYSARHAMVGRYRMRGEEARFLAVGWRETLWHYRMPNNHVPYSVMARVVAKAWLAVRRPAERLRAEVPLRLPALFFGLAGPPALALLLWRLGLPRAGALAAGLLALHPWQVRYASEARGYALAMLLVTGLAWTLVAVRRRGSWPRWLAFGAVQLLLLWTWPAALPLVVCAHLALGALAARGLRGPPRRTQLLRQLVVGIAGAALFLQLMLPNLVQLVAYTAHAQRGAMGPAWWQDAGAHLLAGMAWRNDPPSPVAPELARMAEAAPWAFGGLVAAAGLAVALGAARLSRRHGDLGVALAVLFLLPGPLVHALAAARGTWLHSWYLAFALPGLVALAAAGLEGMAQRLVALAPHRAAPALRAGLALGLLAGFAALTAPMHAAMHDRSFTVQREAVLLTRPSLDPNAPANRRILTASIVDVPEYYDPRCATLRDTAGLRALMRRADTEGLALFVNTGRLGLARRRAPELVALLERPELFEPLGTLHGLVPRLTRHVFRYRGAAAHGGTSRHPVGSQGGAETGSPR